MGNTEFDDVVFFVRVVALGDLGVRPCAGSNGNNKNVAQRLEGPNVTAFWMPCCKPLALDLRSMQFVAGQEYSLTLPFSCDFGFTAVLVSLGFIWGGRAFA